MQPVLITPVTLEFTTDNQAKLRGLGDSLFEPSLGILTLASVLQQAGIAPRVFDLNGFVRGLMLGEPAEELDVCHLAAPDIAAMDADVFGFGTICGSYPLTIRIAGQVKRLRPEARIVLGGPQATVVDVQTLEIFPFVDAVVRGEADETIVPALHQIVAGQEINVPGVTYRVGNRIVRNPNAAPVADLDRVPSPLFELSQSIDRCTYLPIEAGRGCPFSCTFCSTNDFFRRRFRLRSPNRVLEEMDRLYETYGVTRFDLVHDMFTVDRSRVEAFCQAFLARGKRYTWVCSARSDCVDRNLLQLMASAGCTRLFFGIETGSPRLQRIIDKGLDLTEASTHLECAVKHGIGCTVALIVGFPEETKGDVAATAAFALNAARFEQVRIQIALLAALPATPLYEKYREQLFFDGTYSDMSHQSWEQNPLDRELIEQYPVVFANFYGLPSGAGRAYVAEFRHFVSYGLIRCRWLLIALAQSSLSMTDLFDAWNEWLGLGRERGRYYGSPQFPQDLCSFIRQLIVPKLPDESAALALLYYEMLYRDVVHFFDIRRAALPVKSPSPLLPMRSPSLCMMSLPFSFSHLIEMLRTNQPLNAQYRKETTVLFDCQEDFTLNPYELPPLGAALLALCDGQTSIADMVEKLDLHLPCEGISPREFLLTGLACLREQGFVQFEDAQVVTSV